jgi:hypothetical protein
VLHAKLQQRGGPAIAAFAELCVSEPQRSIDDGLARTVQFAGTTGEIER